MRAPRAFTLVELLAVIAIIGILAGILISVVSKARHSGRLAADRSNLRQLALANLAYASANRGKLVVTHDPGTVYATESYWYNILRPWIENAPVNASLINTRCALLISPLDPDEGDGRAVKDTMLGRWRSYNINEQVSAKSAVTFANPSRVIMAGWHQWWLLVTNRITPNAAASLAAIPTTWDNGRANFVFVDGHVESLEVRTLLIGEEGNSRFFTQ